MSKRTSPARPLAAATALALALTTARADAQAPTSRDALDAQRLVVRGKATGAVGLGLLGLGGFLLVGGMAASGIAYDDEGEPGKRLAAAGFAVMLSGAFTALGGVVAYLAGHRRLYRLERARLTAGWTLGGAVFGLRARF